MIGGRLVKSRVVKIGDEGPYSGNVEGDAVKEPAREAAALAL
jgi:hypothetical protein